MKMKPEKVKYSTKNGFSIEWRKPDELVISATDMITMLLYLRSHLTQEEMTKHFTHEEQKAVQKYCLQLEKKQEELLEEYSRKVSVKKIKSDFRRYLDWWNFCMEEGMEKVMRQIWGWEVTAEETLPLVDRLILDILRTDRMRDRARANYLIASIIGDPKMAEPQPETVEKMEKAFGPLDWVKLKEEGFERYKKFYRHEHEY